MKTRKTKITDIDGIAQVEFDRYQIRYSEHPEEKPRFKSMLKQRLEIAQDWMWVLVDKDEIAGAISAQTTNKSLDDFESWEKSTDNGTLRSTFDKTGQNVYVVNLDVSRQATKHNGQYMLMLRFASQVVARGKKLVFFESRMPDFREYVASKYGLEKWDHLAKTEQHQIAEDYTHLKKQDSNKLHDRLLNFYAESGFKFYKVIDNAFVDGESLNFGVVCYTKNPFPKLLRIWPFNRFFGFLVRVLGKNPRILDWLIK